MAFALPRKSRGDRAMPSPGPSTLDRAHELKSVLDASSYRPSQPVPSSTPHVGRRPQAFAQDVSTSLTPSTPRRALRPYGEFPAPNWSASRQSASSTGATTPVRSRRAPAPMTILDDDDADRDAPTASFARDYVEAPSSRQPFAPTRPPAAARAASPPKPMLAQAPLSPVSSTDDPLLLNEPARLDLSMQAAQGDASLLAMVRRFEREDLGLTSTTATPRKRPLSSWRDDTPRRTRPSSTLTPHRTDARTRTRRPADGASTPSLYDRSLGVSERLARLRSPDKARHSPMPPEASAHSPAPTWAPDWEPSMSRTMELDEAPALDVPEMGPIPEAEAEPEDLAWASRRPEDETPWDPAWQPGHELAEDVQAEDWREVERQDAERAEQAEAEREAQRLEAERAEAERAEAEQAEAERLEAERLEAERLEAERLEAERLEAERLEAERREAERREAARLETERRKAEQLKVQRREAEQREAERREAERREAERRETERLDAQRREAERREAERREAERREAERREIERREAERREAERREIERREAERREAERREIERREAEQAEAERLEAERLEAEQAEAERLEAERREAERADAEPFEFERLEAEKADAEQSSTQALLEPARAHSRPKPSRPRSRSRLPTPSTSYSAHAWFERPAPTTRQSNSAPRRRPRPSQEPVYMDFEHAMDEGPALPTSPSPRRTAKDEALYDTSWFERAGPSHETSYTTRTRTPPPESLPWPPSTSAAAQIEHETPTDELASDGADGQLDAPVPATAPGDTAWLDAPTEDAAPAVSGPAELDSDDMVDEALEETLEGIEALEDELRHMANDDVPWPRPEASSEARDTPLHLDELQMEEAPPAPTSPAPRARTPVPHAVSLEGARARRTPSPTKSVKAQRVPLVDVSPVRARAALRPHVRSAQPSPAVRRPADAGARRAASVPPAAPDSPPRAPPLPAAPAVDEPSLSDLSANLSASLASRAMMLARPYPTSCIEVSSLNPVAAARAAAILKVHHQYIQEGYLNDEPLYPPLPGDDSQTLPALLDAAEQALRPATHPLRAQARAGLWTNEAWAQLDFHFRAHLRATDTADVDVDVDEVIVAFLEALGLEPDDLQGAWSLARLYARVPALQARYLRERELDAAEAMRERSFHWLSQRTKRTCDVALGEGDAPGTDAAGPPSKRARPASPLWTRLWGWVAGRPTPLAGAPAHAPSPAPAPVVAPTRPRPRSRLPRPRAGLSTPGRRGAPA